MNQHSSPTRRTLVKGAAWTVPVIATAAAAPAVAASQPLTATNATFQSFVGAFIRSPTPCAPATNPQGGYIDTLCCHPDNTYPSGVADCQQSPSSSNGAWLESTSGGTARFDTFSYTFTFSQPIAIDTTPFSGYSQTGTTRWTAATTWNGWSYSLSSDGKTLTVTYPTPYLVTTSTSVAGSGTCMPGFFVNFHLANACYSTGGVMLTMARSGTFSYRGQTAIPFSKTFSTNF